MGMVYLIDNSYAITLTSIDCDANGRGARTLALTPYADGFHVVNKSHHINIMSCMATNYTANSQNYPLYIDASCSDITYNAQEYNNNSSRNVLSNSNINIIENFSPVFRETSYSVLGINPDISTPTFTNYGDPASATFVQGRKIKGLKMNNGNSLTFPNPELIVTRNNWSIEFSMEFITIPAGYPTLFYITFTDGKNFIVSITPTGMDYTPSFNVQSNLLLTIPEVKENLVINKEYKIGIVRDGNKLMLYYNKVIQGIAYSNDIDSLSAISDIHFGTEGASYYIKNIRVSNTVRTSQEMNEFVLDNSTTIYMPLQSDLSFGQGLRAQLRTAGTTLATKTGTITVSMDGALKTITPTGACTFNANGGVLGQTCSFVVTTSGTTSYILTWGKNFKTIGTLATGIVTAKKFTITFICIDGTNWVEISRTTSM